MGRGQLKIIKKGAELRSHLQRCTVQSASISKLDVIFPDWIDELSHNKMSVLDLHYWV